MNEVTVNGQWLREFADNYRNSTLKDVNADHTRLIELADMLDKHRAILHTKQAHIDALMFEYCPNEMTEEQVAEWAKHQKPVSPERQAKIDDALGLKRTNAG